MMKMKHTIAMTIAAALTAANVGHAANIIATVNPAGPIGLGDEFTVHLSVSGWNAADGEVDAVDFNVDFETSRFEYVPGSGTIVTDGTEFLADNQNASYDPTDESDDGFVNLGRYIFGILDDDTNEPFTGSQLAGGPHPLGSFRLKGIALGTGNIVPKKGTSAVFSDPDLFPLAPTVNFTSASMTVVPEPASALIGLTLLGGVWSATARGRSQRKVL